MNRLRADDYGIPWRTPPIYAAAIFVVCVWRCSLADAGVIALDSFDVAGLPNDYKVGANGTLVGQNPPRLGFTGAWYQSGGGVFTKGGASNNGLSYSAPGLTTIGGSGGSNGSIFTHGFSAVPARDFDASLQTGTETDYWIRFLIQLPTLASGDRGNQFLEFHFTDRIFNIFVLNSDGDGAFNDLVADVTNSGNKALDVFNTDGSTDLVMAHITANRGVGEDEQFDLWVNPTSGVLGTPTLSFLKNLLDGDDTLESLRINLGANKNFFDPTPAFYFDELLISTELNDFTESSAVPEPSTLLLLVVGSLVILCCCAIRRRLPVAAV